MKNEYCFLLGVLFGAAVGMMYEQYRFEKFKQKVKDHVKESAKAPVVDTPAPQPEEAA